MFEAFRAVAAGSCRANDAPRSFPVITKRYAAGQGLSLHDNAHLRDVRKGTALAEFNTGAPSDVVSQPFWSHPGGSAVKVHLMSAASRRDVPLVGDMMKERENGF